MCKQDFELWNTLAIKVLLLNK